MKDHLDQLDVLGRQAASDLDDATRADIERGLAGLYAAQARDRARTWVAAAAVVVAALSTGWFVRGALTHDQAQPADRTVTPPPAVESQALCRRSGVTCLGDRTFRFSLDAPIRWHVPMGFGVDSGAGVSASQVESYWTHQGHAAGVTVLEELGQTAPDGTPLGSTKNPEAFARWFASRPFVTTSAPRRTTVGGRPAWEVRAQLAPGATGSNFAVTNGGHGAGMWQGMVADYAFVGLPGGGTGLVWSWAQGHDTAALDRNHALVEGISWPAH